MFPSGDKVLRNVILSTQSEFETIFEITRDKKDSMHALLRYVMLVMYMCALLRKQVSVVLFIQKGV